MSNGVQHKLYDYEVTPPENTWAKIAEALEEAAKDESTRVKLQELSVNPPSRTWEKISAELDESFEVEDISYRLYAAEVMPPATAWGKIQSGLDQQPEIAKPGRRKIFPALRTAAAILVLAIASYAAWQWLKPAPKQTDLAAKNLAVPSTDKTTAPVPLPDPSTIVPADNSQDADEARNDAALEASKKSMARLDISPKKRKEIASGFRFASAGTGTEDPDHGYTGFEGLPADGNPVADRYILIMTPEGNFIRVSKKLSDLVCCVAGEEPDRECRDQVEKWRKQLACSSAAHPGNFFDILSLVSSLQE